MKKMTTILLALLLAPGALAAADNVWRYTYDDNKNVLSVTDPKGQTIRMCYDVLNRITLKDLPPNFSGCDRASGQGENRLAPTSEEEMIDAMPSARRAAVTFPKLPG